MTMVGGPSVQSAAYAQLLLESGLITGEQLAVARAAKAKTGSHIDEILVGMGMVDPAVLLRVIARSWNLKAVDLATTRIDEDLVRQWSGQLYLAENWMPLRDEPDGRILVATARIPDAERAAHISGVLGAPANFVVATSRDIKCAVLRVFRSTTAAEAANQLWRTSPGLSAPVVLSRVQQLALVVVALTLFMLGILSLRGLVVGIFAVVSIVFLLGIAFTFLVAMRGAKYDRVQRITDQRIALLDDRDLPVYTMLVPVVRDANIVARLTGSLDSIDYPVEKLEILLLVAEEDGESRGAIESANLPARFKVVTVPKGASQTRSRACTVGLFYSTGEFLMVYDPEHAPDPDQLKKAVVAFGNGGENTVGVQAQFGYSNADENVLTRLSTLEHDYWYDYLLPGLDVAGLPVPLGGTSSHFRTAALVELGGWNSYYAAADADLGVRASAMGYRVGAINSTTTQEADASIRSFIRQRSRLVEGYMEMALVYARTPISLIRQIGLTRFLGFALLIAGTPAALLGVIPFYLLAIVTLVLQGQGVSPMVSVWVPWISLLIFIIGGSLMACLPMLGQVKRGFFTPLRFALVTPVCWILHSIAAYDALWRVFARSRRRQKAPAAKGAGLLPH